MIKTGALQLEGRETAARPQDRRLMEQALRLTQGFAHWPHEVLVQLLAEAKLGHYPRTAAIPSAGDELETLAVIAGHIRVALPRSDGASSSLGVIGPGRVIGLSRAIKGDDDETYDYVAVDDAVVIHLHSSLLLDLLAKHPALWKDMALMLLRQERENFLAVVKGTSGSLRQRIAATLEALASSYGTPQSSGVQLRMKLTQNDLAAIVHATRQSINKEIKTWEALGIVSMDRGLITVRDFDALGSFAQGAKPASETNARSADSARPEDQDLSFIDGTSD